MLETAAAPRVGGALGAPNLQILSSASGNSELTAPINSGVEISVIRKPVVPRDDSSGTSIMLTRVFGNQIVDELGYVPLRSVGVPQ